MAIETRIVNGIDTMLPDYNYSRDRNVCSYIVGYFEAIFEVGLQDQLMLTKSATVLSFKQTVSANDTIVKLFILVFKNDISYDLSLAGCFCRIIIPLR